MDRSSRFLSSNGWRAASNWFWTECATGNQGGSSQMMGLIRNGLCSLRFMSKWAGKGGLRGHGSSDQEEAGIPLLALFPLIKRKLFAQALPFARSWRREISLSEHSWGERCYRFCFFFGGGGRGCFLTYIVFWYQVFIIIIVLALQKNI